MRFFYLLSITFVLFFIHIQVSFSEGMRDHTRPSFDTNKNMIEINSAQANELTLTLVKVEQQDVKTWLRLAADIDDTQQILTATFCDVIDDVMGEMDKTYRHPYSDLIKKNQRVLVFPPSSKSSVYRASITTVIFEKQCIFIQAKITRKILRPDRFYMMEILIPRGRFLVVPKEAIIEEDNRQIVYVKTPQGQFIPKTIHSGLKGDLYTEIKHGLREGEQVVTLGSFFIDAQYKLNGAVNTSKESVEKTEATHAHHHH